MGLIPIFDKQRSQAGAWELENKGLYDLENERCCSLENEGISCLGNERLKLFVFYKQILFIINSYRSLKNSFLQSFNKFVPKAINNPDFKSLKNLISKTINSLIPPNHIIIPKPLKSLVLQSHILILVHEPIKFFISKTLNNLVPKPLLGNTAKS